MDKYIYLITGSAAFSQTWATHGKISADNFGDAIKNARLASFEQLTHGTPIYGNPDIGCVGPYKITSFYLELEKE